MPEIDSRSRLEQLGSQVYAAGCSAPPDSSTRRMMMRWADELNTIAASPPEGEERGWRDIASAPKGEPILLLMEGAGQLRRIGYQTDQEPPMVNTWRDHITGEFIGWPIRWTPLPKAMRDPQ